MSKIDDLISPKVEVEFRGEKFMLENGFTLEETPAVNLAFGKSNSPKVRAEGMGMILQIVAKRLYPKATANQIAKVDAKYANDLLEVFFQMDSTEDTEQAEIKKTLEAAAGAK